jgi:hypothetical protein
MHAAGYLANCGGSLHNRGSYGYYWSSTQISSIYGWYLYFGSGSCYMHSSGKADGFSLRRLRE